MSQERSNRSTGPTSPEGKAASSRNALKHGMYSQAILIPGEAPEALDDYRAEMHDLWDPQSPEEHTLVDRLIYLTWLGRRLVGCETGLWTLAINDVEGRSNPLGRAFINNQERLSRVQRMIQARSRENDRVEKRLRELQAARLAAQAAEPAEAPEPVRPEPEFVPSNAPEAPQEPRPHGLRGTTAVRLIKEYAPKLLGREATPDDFAAAIAGTHPLLDEIAQQRYTEWQ